MQLLISFIYMLIQSYSSRVRYREDYITAFILGGLFMMCLLTKKLFDFQEYSTFESPSLRISSLDLGPKHAHKLGAAPFKEWAKTYNKDYVLGQLIFWYKPNESDPGASLEKASRGCLILPDSASCYASSPQHRISYSSLDRLKMFRRMVSTTKVIWFQGWERFWLFWWNPDQYFCMYVISIQVPITKAMLHKCCCNEC